MSVKSERKKKTYEAKKNIPAPVVPILPHYTAAKVVELLNSGDPRVKQNPYGESKSIQLSDEPGYFKYSAKNGGTATFYVTRDKVAGQTRGASTNVPLFTAAITITDEMRKAKCNAEDCNCNSKWFDIVHNCNCAEHHEDGSYDVIPRIETCNTVECDGQHGHLMGFCEVCFELDDDGTKEPKDITADNICLQLR
jgi:hypothetical protein